MVTVGASSIGKSLSNQSFYITRGRSEDFAVITWLPRLNGEVISHWQQPERKKVGKLTANVGDLGSSINRSLLALY